MPCIQRPVTSSSPDSPSDTATAQTSCDTTLLRRFSCLFDAYWDSHYFDAYWDSAAPPTRFRVPVAYWDFAFQLLLRPRSRCLLLRPKEQA